MFSSFKSSPFFVVLGNVLEHFDRALYRLVAPFIACLFFPKFHPIVALILAYMPISFIFRPLGALFFGRIGDRWGRQRALKLSIIGMSVCMSMIGLMPTYDHIGWLSPVCLSLTRGMTCFFAAGEGTAAALTLIEQSKRKELMSSFYEASTMIGIAIATTTVAFLVGQDLILPLWRYLFLASASLGFLIFWSRSSLPQPKSIVKKAISKLEIKKYRLEILSVVGVTGFLYANYSIATAAMNGLLPIISAVKPKVILFNHAWLVIYDMATLPLFALLAKKVGKDKLILVTLLAVLLFYLPLLTALPLDSFNSVIVLRVVMITFGVVIASCYEYWMSSLFPKEQRFRLMALSKAIGAQWIGGPSISICLWVYKETHFSGCFALYLMGCSLLGLISFSLVYFRKLKGIFANQPNQADYHHQPERT